jgi:hypothetical protein
MRIIDIAAIASAAAFPVSAVWLLIKLRQIQRDRFVAVTNMLFQIWQSPDFMKTQLWIIHNLDARSWQEFLTQHAGKEGEAALLRVGGFYNRVGTLVNSGFVDERFILRTIGGTAGQVWQKIQPLVADARVANPGLFADFEGLIPHCASCSSKERR